MKKLADIKQWVRELFNNRRVSPPLHIEYFRVNEIMKGHAPLFYQISWKVVGAASVSLSPRFGTVSSKGKVKIGPIHSDETYQLIAVDKYGNQLTQDLRLKKIWIHEFNASKSIVPEGATVHLDWSVENAKSVFIEGLGHVGQSNSILVKANRKQSSYTLYAYGEGSWAKQKIELTVQAAPEIQLEALNLSPSFHVDKPKIALSRPHIAIQNPITDTSTQFQHLFSKIKSMNMLTGKELGSIDSLNQSLLSTSEELKNQLLLTGMITSLRGLFDDMKQNLHHHIKLNK